MATVVARKDRITIQRALTKIGEFRPERDYPTMGSSGGQRRQMQDGNPREDFGEARERQGKDQDRAGV
jgi:hypothetical protein